MSNSLKKFELLYNKYFILIHATFQHDLQKQVFFKMLSNKEKTNYIFERKNKKNTFMELNIGLLQTGQHCFDE